MLTVVPVSPNAIILLMCSLPVASAVWQAIKSSSQCSTVTGKLDVMKFGACAVCTLLGIVLLCYKVIKKVQFGSDKIFSSNLVSDVFK